MELSRRWPSLLWTEREWYALFRSHPDVYHRIMDDITRASSKILADYEKPLSDRERAYFQAMAYGWSTSDVARYYHVSEDTVKSTLKRGRARMRAVNTTQAVATALGLGQLKHPPRAGPWDEPGPVLDVALG